MALSAAFRERLGHMERTRKQSLSLLQAEKEAQANKSQVLAMKLASMLHVGYGAEVLGARPKDRISKLQDLCAQVRDRSPRGEISIRFTSVEVQSSFVKFQGSDRCTSNGEIAATERRKCELLAKEKELDRKLASNYQTKAQLQKQFQDIITKHKQDTDYQV